MSDRNVSRRLEGTVAIAVAIAMHAPSIASAQATAQGEKRAEAADSADNIARADDIIVTGTRRAARSSLDSSSPVDVVSADEIASVPSSNIQDKLAQTVPSFTVQSKSLYNGLVFIRPATLRGLSPDQTLVLVNGKRQHRSAFVDANVLGGGAQAVDLSQIPAQALSRFEVLRDGASAQYGSDAIAGVINLILRDEVGYSAYAQLGEYYAGDGLNFQAAANAGWALGVRGVLSLTGEYTNSKQTSRSLQREEAAALIAAGNTNIRQPAVTTWGQPELELYRATYNTRFELSDTVTLYSFGLYGHSRGTTNLNWRSPNSSSLRRSVFQDPPFNINPTYSAISRFPGGFTPFLTTKGEDISLVGGLRGEIAEGLTYDASLNWGRNVTSFEVSNSLNPSLGPLSPTEFKAGRNRSSEFDANLDLVYLLEIGLPSPVNVAFGTEYRREEYELRAGEFASYAVGPFRDLPIGAGGQGGISPSSEGIFARDSVAAYLDLDVDLTDRLNIGLAGRYEDFSDFGSTFNGKLSGRFDISPAVAIRGAVSTGFRAPTPGQSFSSNVSVSPDPNNPGQIRNQSLVPPTSAIALSFGAQPLEPEKSLNLSGGLVLRPAPRLSLTVDYYNITVRDRLTLSQLFGSGRDFFNFFVNGFKTRTQGVDLVANYSTGVGNGGTLSVTAAGNFNDTSVRSFLATAVSPSQLLALRRKLPGYTGTASVTYAKGPFETMVRTRYYGSLVDLFFDAAAFSERVDPIMFVDVSASYRITPGLRLTLGAENLFDRYPGRVNWGGPLSATNFLDFGRKYPSALPYSFDGGRYYARVAASF